MNAAGRATGSDGCRASVKATITIPSSVLTGSLVNAGHAVTALGQIIDAGTARALACSARLVPMVIGTPSQPLDIGRATRCFHPAPRHAIVNRDRECTFRSGGTARTERSEAGEIGDTEVVWDLVPGRMPTQSLPPDDPLTHGPGAPPDHAQTA
ncbi:DUF222 domain-containing protein [Leekyejoonella antrihumi]|uniref:DUF222 domain-containing protein n=1 Tax=Leekyejoonella antrihumi TaxID=1660198 RepID=UPI001646D953|nr:DUF222 domain-containing protein [Leekyejoonella antrihumi]